MTSLLLKLLTHYGLVSTLDLSIMPILVLESRMCTLYIFICLFNIRICLKCATENRALRLSSNSDAKSRANFTHPNVKI